MLVDLMSPNQRTPGNALLHFDSPHLRLKFRNRYYLYNNTLNDLRAAGDYPEEGFRILLCFPK